LSATASTRTSGLGVLVFVVSDAMTFAGLLLGALMLRRAGRDWPSAAAGTVGQLVSLTALLFAGSAFIAVARRRGSRWLLGAAAAGAAFVTGELIEWRALATAHHGPATDLRHASLFVITGLHGLHVTIGAALLVGYGLRGAAGSIVRAMALYWLALDVAWLGILLVVYR
jgi:heme/copper-type cytochrome/quinol oxidase subunit 3